MKKENIKSIWKGKGFYVSLGIGVIALAAIGGISYNMFGGNQNDAVPKQQNQVVQEAVVEEKDKVVLPAAVAATPEAVAQKESDNQTKKVDSQKVVTDVAKTTPVDSSKAVEETVPVLSTDTKTSNLHFDEEKGLLWPITGNVIMNYSMDGTIYFQTLAQYKCNPALIISGEVGTEVFCAADGIVTDITKNEETGTTVTTSVGDGYYLVYGQLKDLTVEVGDSVAEGNVIGMIADPTKYYVVEGSNLYFQVLEGEDTVNPLLLLR